MTLRFISLAFLFAFSFAGTFPSKSKSKKKKSSARTAQTEQAIQVLPQTIQIAPRDEIYLLRRSMDGLFFTFRTYIYFHPQDLSSSEHTQPNLVGQSRQAITQFCTFNDSNSAYYVSGTSLFFISENLQISEGMELGAPVQSLVCTSKTKALFSTGFEIYEIVEGRVKKLVYTHDRIVSKIVVLNSHYFFLSESNIFVLELQNQARLIRHIHSHTTNIVGFDDDLIVYTEENLYSYFSTDTMELGSVSYTANDHPDSILQLIIGPSHILYLLTESGAIHQRDRFHETQLSTTLIRSLSIHEIAVRSHNSLYIATPLGLYIWVRESHTGNLNPVVTVEELRVPLRTLTIQRLLQLTPTELPLDIIFPWIGLYLALLEGFLIP